MPNNYFNFKQFTINQEGSAFKVGTDGVLLGAYANLEGAESVLDVGAGTGLISLMIAQRCNARITALEPDYESCLQTIENAQNSPWSDRITVRNTRLQEFDNEGCKFDLIVSNPPYFKDSLRNPDPKKSAARHNDTLSTGELLTGVTKFMKDNGHLQIIMPYVEGNIFIAEAARYGLYCNSILKIKPLPSAEIRRLILRFSRVYMKPSESFLTIEHGNRHEFTDEYIELTKAFYLKF
jgi:tRNA1Val (adenine37-N6)-methyltransferase